MATKGISSKRALIDKSNSTLVIITSVAAFVVVFSLVATKTLISQAAYQNRVIDAKRTAVNQLKADQKAVDSLKASYDAFNSTAKNIIGGDPNGNGPQDGPNYQIVLDALPSSYDFPALATSLEKIMTGQNVTIDGISGTDDEVAQSSNTASGSPQPVAMPFQISVTGSYQAIQSLVSEFEHSIRPFQIQTITLSGDQSNLNAQITAQTFYQPAKTFSIGSKVVK